jgi:hypothetical protein
MAYPAGNAKHESADRRITTHSMSGGNVDCTLQAQLHGDRGLSINGLHLAPQDIEVRIRRLSSVVNGRQIAIATPSGDYEGFATDRPVVFVLKIDLSHDKEWAVTSVYAHVVFTADASGGASSSGHGTVVLKAVPGEEGVLSELSCELVFNIDNSDISLTGRIDGLETAFSECAESADWVAVERQ